MAAVRLHVALLANEHWLLFMTSNTRNAQYTGIVVTLSRDCHMCEIEEPLEAV